MDAHWDIFLFGIMQNISSMRIVVTIAQQLQENIIELVNKIKQEF